MTVASFQAKDAAGNNVIVYTNDDPSTGAKQDTANNALGATTGAKVITDANGTIQQYLRGLVSQWISGTLVVGAGANIIGDVGPSLRATSNGLTSSRVDAAASTNSTSVKASAGRIGQIDVFNVATSMRYLKFYNKASGPTVGTDTPVWVIPLPANSGYSGNFPFGKYFATGIAYAITGGAADSDTTAVTAHDVTGSIDWI